MSRADATVSTCLRTPLLNRHRDASNWKVPGSCVVGGHYQEIDLFASESREDLFIPELVAIQRLWRR